MWCMQSVLVLVCCVLVSAGPGGLRVVEGEGVATTTRAPRKTLDRAAAELAWQNWLQSPESVNPNAPPRRITTKSLFITPLVCPKGQRLDRNACVQVVTVGKEEHERILLEQLNAFFTSAPSRDVVYDYGENDAGPLQLSIPIGLDPQAEPLQAQDPSVQAQELQPSFVKFDKKEENKDIDRKLEAELELLRVQHNLNSANETAPPDGYGAHILNHNVLALIDKLKRDSPDVSSTEVKTSETDTGQKEVVYGQINIDPILTEDNTENQETTTEIDVSTTDLPHIETTTTDSKSNTNNDTIILLNISDNLNKTTDFNIPINTTTTPSIRPEASVNSTTLLTKKENDQTKLNPENDYADIGEAIKLISRYAEVTTDDNFTKDQNNVAAKEDGILGTRTKMQHRRNKPKPTENLEVTTLLHSTLEHKKKNVIHAQIESREYFRYPWQSQNLATPPPDYPFKHLQDYWKGRNKIGGLYNTARENPRRHHHAISENYFRPHGLSYGSYPNQGHGILNVNRIEFQPYPHRALPRHVSLHSPVRDDPNLNTLLGLKHWFSSEGTSKR